MLVELYTIHILRILSSKAQGRKDFRKPSKPCHAGIHWIALAEYFWLSTHVPGFLSLFAGFCISLYFAKLATTSIRVELAWG